MLRFRSQTVDSPQLTTEPSERIHIWNLNFFVGEKELTDYLKEYGVTWVVVPVQPVYGFRKRHPQSLGIAYAGFENKDKAKTVIKELYNKDYKGRPMKLRFHTPYEPKEKDKKKSQKMPGNNREIELASEETTGSPVESNSTDYSSSTFPSDGSRKVHKRRKEVSKETVYCKVLPEGTTDSHLREHFKEYHPKEIWIFKSTPIKRKSCIGSRNEPFTSALVTLNTNEPLKKVAKVMSKKKLLENKVMVRPAFLTKIEEVKNIADQDRATATIQEVELDQTRSTNSPECVSHRRAVRLESINSSDASYSSSGVVHVGTSTNDTEISVSSVQ